MAREERKRKIESVRIKYFKPEGYEPIYVSGVYGGVTPRGDLVCHFFYEYTDVPDEEFGPVKDGKLQLDELERVDRIEHGPNELVVRRDVRMGIVIPVHQVPSITEWMLNTVKQASIEDESKEGN